MDACVCLVCGNTHVEADQPQPCSHFHILFTILPKMKCDGVCIHSSSSLAVEGNCSGNRAGYFYWDSLAQTGTAEDSGDFLQLVCASVLLVTPLAFAGQVRGDDTGLLLFMSLTVTVTHMVKHVSDSSAYCSRDLKQVPQLP